MGNTLSQQRGGRARAASLPLCPHGERNKNKCRACQREMYHARKEAGYKRPPRAVKVRNRRGGQHDIVSGRMYAIEYDPSGDFPRGNVVSMESMRVEWTAGIMFREVSSGRLCRYAPGGKMVYEEEK